LNRASAFGQDQPLSWVDRFGVWLSARQIHRWSGDVRGQRICDVGSGYHARLAHRMVLAGGKATAVDMAVSANLRQIEGLECVEGQLPNVLEGLAAENWDLVLCISVLEHLWEPEVALAHFHRMLVPGGICLINVPSWSGKRFLEYSAFHLGLSPKTEMDDHKMYYDVKDLWPLLVRAGFLPSGIHCFKHKYGLNTFAACRKEGP